MSPSDLPPVTEPTVFGNASNYWIESPDGTVDLTRSVPIDSPGSPQTDKNAFSLKVDGGRTLRIAPSKSAIVVVDMQNYFLHPAMRDHPLGLAAVEPLAKSLTTLRKLGVRVIWLNWGVNQAEVDIMPPSLARCFSKPKGGVMNKGFGSDLGSDKDKGIEFGRLLMRDQWNSQLYGVLHEQWIANQDKDVWIHKNRMSGLWGQQTMLGEYLEKEGIKTLLFSGVNSDQCVLGTVTDAFSKGYDIVAVTDTIATASPGGQENVIYNCARCYGFTTDSKRVLAIGK